MDAFTKALPALSDVHYQRRGMFMPAEQFRVLPSSKSGLHVSYFATSTHMTVAQPANVLMGCLIEKFASIKRPPKVRMAIPDSVYLAKLAEQAERYEGELSTSPTAGRPD